MTHDLAWARREIAGIDAQMAELFVERMRAAEVVEDKKKAHGMPVLDEAQEQKVMQRNLSFVPDLQIQAYYKSFMQEMLRLSKQYQYRLIEGMRVSYNGVEGAFAHIAAGRIFPNAVLTACASFDEAYDAVVRGDCDAAVIPIENSFAGEVGRALDLMFNGELFITGVYTLPIVQNLLAVPGGTLDQIRRVVSHPQALSQCASYIRKHGWQTVSAESTAEAARRVAAENDPQTAAIASAETAALHGLCVLDHDVNESVGNTTKFAVFSREKRTSPLQGGQFILMFTALDEPGSLAKAINIISDHGFNMTALRSRPVLQQPWQYYFYVEAEGSVETPEGKAMLRELSAQCDKLKVVGAFGSPTDLRREERV